MSRRCAFADTPDTPLLLFKRGSMSRLNMLTLDCNSDNCDFQTPPLNREHYQAMVAHLQVREGVQKKKVFFWDFVPNIGPHPPTATPILGQSPKKTGLQLK